MRRKAERQQAHGAMSVARTVAIALLSLLAILQVVRQAFVSAYGSTDPIRASAVWAGHPDVAFKVDLETIARTAASGRPVPRGLIDHALVRARYAPLVPEPFLIKGVDARLAGDETVAGKAFIEAKRRAPRSIAARYFLADHYLRTNQGDAGLAELAVLTRLVPNALAGVAPYYAAFAKGPGGATRIRSMLRAHPEFESAVLAALADDPRNVDLILFLASGKRGAEQAPAWQGRLVQSLVAAGQFAKARAVWVRVAGPAVAGAPPSALFDPRFERTTAPPPFGWLLMSGESAVAEAQADGRLHLLYYGRDNVVLASQLLLLEPGSYRLSFNVDRTADARALGWRLTCRLANRPILSLDLGDVRAPKTLSATFRVSDACPAQMIELIGTSPEFPETIDLTVSNLTLSKVSG